MTALTHNARHALTVAKTVRDLLQLVNASFALAVVVKTPRVTFPNAPALYLAFMMPSQR
jgi:hypothetical protein